MNMKCILSAVAVALGTQLSTAQIRLASPFADSMVLQRDRAVAVWGSAEPDELSA